MSLEFLNRFDIITLENQLEKLNNKELSNLIQIILNHDDDENIQNKEIIDDIWWFIWGYGVKKIKMKKKIKKKILVGFI